MEETHVHLAKFIGGVIVIFFVLKMPVLMEVFCSIQWKQYIMEVIVFCRNYFILEVNCILNSSKSS